MRYADSVIPQPDSNLAKQYCGIAIRAVWIVAHEEQHAPEHTGGIRSG